MGKIPTAENASERYSQGVHFNEYGTYTDKNGKKHDITHLTINANVTHGAGFLTSPASILLINIDGRTILIENPQYGFFTTPAFRIAIDTDQDEYLTLRRRFDEAMNVIRAEDIDGNAVFDDEWWDTYAPLIFSDEEPTWNVGKSMYVKYRAKPAKKRNGGIVTNNINTFNLMIHNKKISAHRKGGIAVKINRGNGIEGYALASCEDVNWVRNAEGRYIPQLKLFASGGKTRKFLPGGKSAFDLFSQLSGDIKEIGKSVLDNKELSNFGPEVIQGALEMIRNKNRMKTSENAVHRIPLSLINWANLYLRNLQAPNNISLKARFLEDNGMQIGPNGLPVYTEGLNNSRNW